MIEMKRNDLEPSVRGIIEAPPGTPVDITGCPVRFIMRLQGSVGVLPSPPKVDAYATVVDGVAGIVEYAWADGDTDTAGTYLAEFEVTFAGGRRRTFPSKGHLFVVISPDLDG
jgi:hypothetical protein